jgi:hypothetical protein
MSYTSSKLSHNIYPIPGYEGYLLDEGFDVIGKKGRPLTLCASGPYKFVNVMKDGKPTTLFHHRAIALVHVGGYFDGAVVDHIDNNPNNNNPSNLRWTTHKENYWAVKATPVEKRLADLDKKISALLKERSRLLTYLKEDM